MEDRIVELLTPIVEEVDVDILKVSLGGGRRPLLKVVLDAAGGVPFDVLERISRALSLQLDAEDLVASCYQLEVTSPGFDWPLSSAADFRRHRGERLKALFAEAPTLMGENLGPCDNGVRLLLDDGNEKDIDMDSVLKIVRVVDWKRASNRKKKIK
ncbi:MAG: ribosome assembly cofactor RimP [Mariprofundaceae bacterium]|nr:ribosome assembly cofactor RimP [Mariprofundaceae bacterium]